MLEKNIGQLPPLCVPNGDQTGNVGIGSEWELNSHAFGVQDNAPSESAGQGEGLFFVLF